MTQILGIFLISVGLFISWLWFWTSFALWLEKKYDFSAIPIIYFGAFAIPCVIGGLILIK